eukprot:COSAG06_NODE_399_length_16207_cov_61.131984_3_plen_104_part_00
MSAYYQGAMVSGGVLALMGAVNIGICENPPPRCPLSHSAAPHQMLTWAAARADAYVGSECAGGGPAFYCPGVSTAGASPVPRPPSPARCVSLVSLRARPIRTH